MLEKERNTLICDTVTLMDQLCPARLDRESKMAQENALLVAWNANLVMEVEVLQVCTAIGELRCECIHYSSLEWGNLLFFVL